MRPVRDLDTCHPDLECDHGDLNCCHPERSEGSAVFACTDRLRRFSRTVIATLREIFDESAYARFRHSKQLAISASSYAAFIREQQAMKARRPKCC